MTTLLVPLDDEVNAALDALCAEQKCEKAIIVSDLVNQFVRVRQSRSALQDPALIALYQELADEDVALAEAGMGDYAKLLNEADRT